MIPCLIFEDEHVLVVNKPAGMNTHAPARFAGEGIYDWLRHREPRWAGLAIIHRLDKETSGLIVFGKTPRANRALTAQFTGRTVGKTYLFLTHRSPRRRAWSVTSRITRAGDRYVSAPHGEPAETRFRLLNSGPATRNSKLIEAVPLTGRTHQIRVHAAESGVPILGDTLYGGAAFGRVCLHAAGLTFRHPASGNQMEFRSPADFLAAPAPALRAALLDPAETDTFRLIHGASDGWPGWYVDALGEFLLSQSETNLHSAQRQYLESLLANDSGTTLHNSRLTSHVSPLAFHASRFTGVYHKILQRRIRGVSPAAASPERVLGKAAPDRFVARENGLPFDFSFNEGYSVGLFLDQRDNRRRLLTGHIAPHFPLFNPKPKTQNPKLEILNTFAYTCGFSVCAARAGARTTSIDLSKRHLEWGRRNFALNGLDPGEHEFICGEVRDWLRRLARKQRSFDVILLDPPTFSQSRTLGTFRIEKDYPDLVRAALPLLRPDGILFAATNAAGWSPAAFLASVEGAIRTARRSVRQRHYGPQPPDFPVSRAEPAYLKTVWLRIE